MTSPPNTSSLPSPNNNWEHCKDAHLIRRINPKTDLTPVNGTNLVELNALAFRIHPGKLEGVSVNAPQIIAETARPMHYGFKPKHGLVAILVRDVLDVVASHGLDSPDLWVGYDPLIPGSKRENNLDPEIENLMHGQIWPAYDADELNTYASKTNHKKSYKKIPQVAGLALAAKAKWLLPPPGYSKEQLLPKNWLDIYRDRTEVVGTY